MVRRRRDRRLNNRVTFAESIAEEVEQEEPEGPAAESPEPQEPEDPREPQDPQEGGQYPRAGQGNPPAEEPEELPSGSGERVQGSESELLKPTLCTFAHLQRIFRRQLRCEAATFFSVIQIQWLGGQSPSLLRLRLAASSQARQSTSTTSRQAHLDYLRRARHKCW